MTQARNSQQSLFKLSKQMAYGGELYKKAKGRGSRPLSTKAAHHIVLRSDYAVGENSFRSAKNKKKVFQTIHKHSKICGIKILELAVSGNHIHFLIRFSRRSYYIRWIRRITAALVFVVTGWNKYKGSLKERLANSSRRGTTQIKNFWNGRPFSRVVEGFRNYSIARDYVILNALEAIGQIPYRVQRLKGIRGFELPLLI